VTNSCIGLVAGNPDKKIRPAKMNTLLPQAVAEVAQPERLLLDRQQSSFRFADLSGVDGQPWEGNVIQVRQVS
jgi:hypothetical protein